MKINDIFGKQALEEQARAPLYHATSLDSALSIIASGEIRSLKRVGSSPKYRSQVYMSRSWSNALSARSYKYGPVVFHINQDSLKQSNKVKPHAGFVTMSDKYYYDQSVERTKKPISLKHVDAISVNDNGIHDDAYEKIQNQLEMSPYKHIKLFRHSSIVRTKNKQQIEEQARAPLYHATSLKNLKNIILDGGIKIKGHDYDPNGDYTISTTRDRFLAQSERFRRAFGPIVIHIDQNALGYNTKITPFDYGGFSTEAEEQIHGNIDLKYVTHISVPNSNKYDDVAYQVEKRLEISAYNHIDVIRHKMNNYNGHKMKFEEYENEDYKKYLEEQARAPLYHATTVDNTASIIASGKIKIAPNERGDKVISTTRSKRMAQNSFFANGFGHIIFHIDQDSLRNNTKMRSWDWFQNDPSRVHQSRLEKEEQIQGDIDLKHVTHISVADRKEMYIPKIQKWLDDSPYNHIKVIQHKTNRGSIEAIRVSDKAMTDRIRWLAKNDPLYNKDPFFDQYRDNVQEGNLLNKRKHQIKESKIKLINLKESIKYYKKQEKSTNKGLYEHLTEVANRLTIMKPSAE